METVLREVKRGDLFQLKPDGPIWVRGDYDRASKTYECYKWEDVNHYSYMKGSRKVWTD